jgi:hypothetical protein
MADVLRTNAQIRVRYDDDYWQARNQRSSGNFAYRMSDGHQDGCSVLPAPQDYLQCDARFQSRDAVMNNYLRFGEPFTSYEPGHSVSTPLQAHSVYKGRGEGVIQRGQIDIESALIIPPKADAADIRNRSRIREIDETSRKFPPTLGPRVPRGCPQIYETIVVESKAFGPHGGRSTRADLRNASVGA